MNKKSASFFVILSVFVLTFTILFSQLFFQSTVPEVTANNGENNDLVYNNEILVKFKANPEIMTVKVGPNQDFDVILEYYNQLSYVEYAEPNFKTKGTIIPSDTYYNNQWYLQRIRANEAWDTVRESPKIIIAILDSGVQITHPDLKDNIWINKKEIAGNGIDDDKNGFIDDVNGWDFVNNVNDPSPKFKDGFTEIGILHGTIVAGIAAAAGNNATGIAGITWKTQIMPLKVLDDKCEGSTAQVVKAIDYAIANGADIINLSFVSFGYTRSLDEAIKRAYDAGVIVVAAAGNEQGQGDGYNLDETPMYPVCLDGPNRENRVIGVAATDTIDQKTSFSSYGSRCVDISAPGISVFSTVVYNPDKSVDQKSFNKYYDGYWSGTSVAVPMVSGAIALIEATNPALKHDQIVKILLNTADKINSVNPNYLDKLGTGRLNLKSAVSQAKSLLNNQIEKIAVTPASNYSSLVKITDKDGKLFNSFYAYDKSFKGGVNLATCDLNNDGVSEIITAPGKGGGPHIKIFNLQGELLGQFFYSKEKIVNGTNLACADVDNDGKNEIIIGAGSNAEPQIKIFDYKQKLKSSFMAFAKNFRGGVNLATGDIDGDGESEIIAGAGPGNLPLIRIFKYDGALLNQFLAYDKKFKGGVRVTVANLNGGSISDKINIIASPQSQGGPHIRIFDDRGQLVGQFFSFDQKFRGGVNLSSGDLDNDGLDEIITAAGPGGGPHVRIFKDRKIIGAFYAYEESYSGGVNTATIKIIK